MGTRKGCEGADDKEVLASRTARRTAANRSNRRINSTLNCKSHCDLNTNSHATRRGLFAFFIMADTTASNPPQELITRESLSRGFLAAGVRRGGVLLVHSSLSSFGRVDGGADTVIDALLDALGPDGTLCVPTLSYLFVDADRPEFDVTQTPTNLGAIPNTFRQRPGVLRSLHPTHSVAALGPAAARITGDHWRDTSPVGPHSPFTALAALGGQVAFLGCGARCNTSIHGVEEALPGGPPPYLLLPGEVEYSLVDAAGARTSVRHRRHDFAGVGQRYERLVAGMPAGAYSEGRVGLALVQASGRFVGVAAALPGPLASATTPAAARFKPCLPLCARNLFLHPRPTTTSAGLWQVFDAAAMWAHATALLSADPRCLVEDTPEGEGHFLVQGATAGGWRYRVAPTMAPIPAP